MRIAVANWSTADLGAQARTLAGLFASLEAAGHEIALLHERDAPVDHPRLQIGAQVPVWNVEALGIDRAVAALGAWKPDVLFSHGFLDPQIEEQTLDVAPAVFFAHDYYGTCISGFKTHRRPTTQPCDRVFGWRCLIEYHVRGAAAGARFPWCANSAVSRAASNDCAGIGRSSLTSDRMREEACAAWIRVGASG